MAAIRFDAHVQSLREVVNCLVNCFHRNLVLGLDQALFQLKKLPRSERDGLLDLVHFGGEGMSQATPVD